MGPRSVSLGAAIGWGGRIRTHDLLSQNQAPYHLATPQRRNKDCYKQKVF